MEEWKTSQNSNWLKHRAAEIICLFVFSKSKISEKLRTKHSEHNQTNKQPKISNRKK